MDMEALLIHLREAVEGRLRLHHAESRNSVDGVVNEITLFCHPSLRRDIAPDALVAAERGLNDGLRRYIRAEPHGGKHLDAFDVVLRDRLVAGQDHPADPEARDHMGLRQSGKSDTEQIRRQRGDGGMRTAVHQEPVVNLIRKDDQLMSPRDLDDLLKNLLRVDGACRIVGIDDDKSLRPVRDLGLHILKIRIPVALLIAEVVHHLSPCERSACRPQRIIGSGNQDFVPVVKQGLHHQIDQLGYAVSGVDVIHFHIGDAPELGVLHDRFPGGPDSLRIGITLAVPEIPGHITDHLFRRVEAEGRRIPDIQLENFDAVADHPVGFLHHRTADIVEDIVKLCRFAESAHDIPPCRNRRIKEVRRIGANDVRIKSGTYTNLILFSGSVKKPPAAFRSYSAPNCSDFIYRTTISSSHPFSILLLKADETS